ncbi:MAG: ABC transporter substrate-binding protein [Fibrobacter sp.]|jgi:peptide/nickel transport system substrate-binding protein|nr:ABC transporter substrate-binding protein [Fibrobacter sp.]
MNLKSLLPFKVLLASAVFCGLLSCQSGQKNEGETGFPRSKTLYIAGFQWGDPNTFNPLNDWPAFPVGGNYNLMYEPLMNFNSLTGDIEPLLARSYEKTPDVISAVLDSRARWSDGKPLTAEDVVFTYEVGKKYPGAPTAYVWNHISNITVDNVEIEGGKAERINFTINKERNNPLVVLDFFQAVRIIPKHVLQPMLDSLGDLSAVQKDKMDKNPVVSGPYTLDSYSAEKIVLKRRDDYWGTVLHDGKLPKPQYIIHPIYKSNDHFSISLQQGNLDISSTFIPRIWQKEKNGVRTWYSKEPYFVPAAMVMLMVNHTKAPLSDKNFRKAMAHAINYADVKDLAFSQYSLDLKPGLILPFGTEEPYFSKDDTEKYGCKYDPETAKKILVDAGYKSVFKADGQLDYMLDPKGKKIPTLLIRSPAGWTDWESMVQIAVKGMRAAGIDVREGFVDASVYFNSMPTAEWDLLLHAPSVNVTPSQPWARFESVMSSRNWKPAGEKMNENQGRYNQPGTKEYNPKVDSLLRVIPTLTEQEQKVAAYQELNVIFMQDQPSLPLVYRPEQFYEFSVKSWTNFPNEQNPYTPPQIPCFGVGTKALWEIEPTAK